MFLKTSSFTGRSWSQFTEFNHGYCPFPFHPLFFFLIHNHSLQSFGRSLSRSSFLPSLQFLELFSFTLWDLPSSHSFHSCSLDQSSLQFGLCSPSLDFPWFLSLWVFIGWSGLPSCLSSLSNMDPPLVSSSLFMEPQFLLPFSAPGSPEAPLDLNKGSRGTNAKAKERKRKEKE